MRQNNQIIVTISCATYNHELYIRQCLEGFVMQKTNFRFEAIVNDDASTDGTAAIVREFAQKYPDIIKPIYQKENQYSKGVDIFHQIMIPQAQGKYIAICEGDDYWIDPSKLQKQVDFLEANPEYGMCYSKIRRYLQAKKQYGRIWGGSSVQFEDLIHGNTIPTLSVLLRRDLYLKYREEIQPEKKGWLMGDYPMWLWFSHNSKIYFIDELTGVYRMLQASASHSTSVEKEILFVMSGIDIQEYFCKLYSQLTIDFEYQRWLSKLYKYAISNCFRSFIDCWSRGAKSHPTYMFRLKPYKYLLFFISMSLREKYRQ